MNPHNDIIESFTYIAEKVTNIKAYTIDYSYSTFNKNPQNYIINLLENNQLNVPFAVSKKKIYYLAENPEDFKNKLKELIKKEGLNEVFFISSNWQTEEIDPFKNSFYEIIYYWLIKRVLQLHWNKTARSSSTHNLLFLLDYDTYEKRKEFKDRLDIALSLTLTGLRTLKTLLLILDIKYINKQKIMDPAIKEVAVMKPNVRYNKTKMIIENVFTALDEIELKIPNNEQIRFQRIKFN